ncbi:MAG: Bcr/CflA family efflux MFS transporter [Rubrivivax sp.]|nr:MAG: Bcr/CflA family efflux MFS transporter [Rubrivivax sp.]
MTSAAAPLPVPRPEVPLWLPALFIVCSTLAMHVFVPALPLAAADLGASPHALQLSISLYIAGLAAGQLVYGPLADRYGRRPVLLAGLGLYTLAGLAASLAPTAGMLIAARLLQALGGCSGMVLARAIVRDTSTTADAASRMASVNLIVTIAPGIAPIIGAAMAPALGWRSILIALTVLGVAAMLVAWRQLPETGRHAQAQDLRSLAHAYAGLLRSPAFLGYSVGGGCATTAMYAFIAAAPFIFVDQLHRPAHEVGWCLAMLVSGIWLGSMLATRLLRRFPLRPLLIGANAVSVAAALALLGLVLLDQLTVAGTVGTMFLFTLGAGLSSPAALTQAISVDPTVTGSASGLYGCMQMAVGAVCSSLVGLGGDPALAAALTLSGAGLVGQFGFWIAGRDRPRS